MHSDSIAGHGLEPALVFADAAAQPPLLVLLEGDLATELLDFSAHAAAAARGGRSSSVVIAGGRAPASVAGRRRLPSASALSSEIRD